MEMAIFQCFQILSRFLFLLGTMILLGLDILTRQPFSLRSFLLVIRQLAKGLDIEADKYEQFWLAIDYMVLVQIELIRVQNVGPRWNSMFFINRGCERVDLKLYVPGKRRNLMFIILLFLTQKVGCLLSLNCDFSIEIIEVFYDLKYYKIQTLLLFNLVEQFITNKKIKQEESETLRQFLLIEGQWINQNNDNLNKILFPFNCFLQSTQQMEGSKKLLETDFDMIETCKDKVNAFQFNFTPINLYFENVPQPILPNSLLSLTENYNNTANPTNVAGVNNAQSSKKILILDDSIIEDSPNNQKGQEKIQQKLEHKIKLNRKRAQPLNPFQQILHQHDTPDFNMTLPFTDEFSKIQLKSPTFSDVLSLSQFKSSQIYHQQESNKFFIAPKKYLKPPQFYESYLTNQPKIIQEQKSFKQKIKFDQLKSNNASKNEISLISTIKISKPLETPTKKSSQKANKLLTPAKIMSEHTYKIKNHQSPLTPRIKNISSLLQQQNNIKTCQKFTPNDESIESSLQIEGRSMTPSYTSSNVRLKISPRLQQSCLMTDNLPTKRPNEVPFLKNPNKSEIQRISFYKKGQIKKLQLEQQLQQIYRGKFKLNRTMRF